MNRAVKAFRNKLADRSGLTLLEVMMALGIFVVGAVGIVALFMTASVLHVDANNRRRASFIAGDLLAQTRAMRFRDVFARTQVVNDTGTDIDTDAVVADGIHETANFDLYPFFDVFFPLQGGQAPGRTEGPILIQGEGGLPPVDREWAWYTLNPLDPDTFFIAGADRGLWGPPSVLPHSPGQSILEPRTWLYVLDVDMPAPPPPPPPFHPVIDTVAVRGDPAGSPGPTGAPNEGYVVIEEEWMPYESCGPASFVLKPTDADGDGIPDVRGWGGTQVVAHLAGTPVTVAREHPYYPGFYYTLQFYPTDATGQEAHIVITIGYGTDQRFRVYTFRSIFAPTRS